MLHHSCTEDTTSCSRCSSSGSEQAESEAEGDKDFTEDEETVVALDQTGEASAEETSAECAAANSAGDSTEIDISDSSIPSGNEMKQSDDTSGDTEAAEMVGRSNQDAEQERGECKTDKCWIFPLLIPAELINTAAKKTLSESVSGGCSASNISVASLQNVFL